MTYDIPAESCYTTHYGSSLLSCRLYCFIVREGIMGTTNHSGAPPRLARPIRAGARCLRLHTAHGQGLVEYALILVLVAIVVIGVLSSVGVQTSQVFAQVNCTLAGGPTHQDQGNGNSNRCN
jgi:pilus assembly protein Flp/PilA